MDSLHDLTFDLQKPDAEHTTELFQAVLACNHNHVVEQCMINRQDIDKQDQLGKTPLAWACIVGDPLTVKILISMNANIEAQDNHGYTPLMWAVQGAQGNCSRDRQ